jgi:hypothetical protein
MGLVVLLSVSTLVGLLAAVAVVARFRNGRADVGKLVGLMAFTLTTALTFRALAWVLSDPSGSRP